MAEPIEDVYFNWLCAKVVQRHTHNYVSLLAILHTTEFVWLLPADRHRSEDGIELKLDFQRETGMHGDFFWEEAPCSVLELLISFANRASFQTDIPLKDWFWVFIRNLHLDEYRRVYSKDEPVIQQILHDFVWRQYDRHGNGGIFPMLSTNNDQREIELWYQLAEYLDDRGLV